MLNDEEKLAFLSKINSKLLESNGITCYEFELFNQLKNELDDDYTLERNKKIGAENNSNEEKIENRITQEKIKASIERIISYIKDKKEYEFISDYFINEFDPSVNSHFIKNNSSSDIINHKESNISQSSFIDTDLDKIDENFLNLLANTSLTDINSINKLREEINKNKNINNNNEISNISNKSSFGFKKNSGLDDIFLPEMKKVKSSNDSKSNENIGLENKEQMDKELEEEINRQIFGYTKKMKESARNFGVQLRKDNQTLSNIENLQDKVNEKTNTQVKRLQNFNYNLKIGFCKLMLLIFTVVGSFFGTIFIMKIFPKLA